MVIGEVTSEVTIGVNETDLGVDTNALLPVAHYNVSIAALVSSTGGYQAGGYQAGDWIIVAQIGGTFGHTTENVTGYPSLAVGSSYVFFLTTQANIADAYNGELLTTGGPQGLFDVQNGSVYSLDNTYPQADSWMPVKVDGTSLNQFISEVQATAASSTTTTYVSSTEAAYRPQ